MKHLKKSARLATYSIMLLLFVTGCSKDDLVKPMTNEHNQDLNIKIKTTTQTNETPTKNWPQTKEGYAIMIGKKLWKMHMSDKDKQMIFLDHKCTPYYKSHIHLREFSVVYDGKFECPSLTSIIGIAECKATKDEAIKAAMINFMEKISVHLTFSELEQIRNTFVDQDFSGCL